MSPGPEGSTPSAPSSIHSAPGSTGEGVPSTGAMPTSLHYESPHPGFLILPHRSLHVQRIAVAGVSIGDDGHIDGGGDIAGILHHLRHREQPDIGIATGRCRPETGHVHGGE